MDEFLIAMMEIARDRTARDRADHESQKLAAEMIERIAR